MFGPESEGVINNWNQVNPDFPDVKDAAVRTEHGLGHV